jgi:hypothetical protein
VFTGGRFWIREESVPVILAENGYVVVADPRPGDLAIYAEGGLVGHTAVVRYVAPERPVLVEGKWGAGPVFLHDVRDEGYAPFAGYYRSPRAGHLLALTGASGDPVAGMTGAE